MASIPPSGSTSQSLKPTGVLPAENQAHSSKSQSKKTTQTAVVQQVGNQALAGSSQAASANSPPLKNKVKTPDISWWKAILMRITNFVKKIFQNLNPKQLFSKSSAKVEPTPGFVLDELKKEDPKKPQSTSLPAFHVSPSGSHFFKLSHEILSSTTKTEVKTTDQTPLPPDTATGPQKKSQATASKKLSTIKEDPERQLIIAKLKQHISENQDSNPVFAAKLKERLDQMLKLSVPAPIEDSEPPSPSFSAEETKIIDKHLANLEQIDGSCKVLDASEDLAGIEALINLYKEFKNCQKKIEDTLKETPSIAPVLEAELARVRGALVDQILENAPLLNEFIEKPTKFTPDTTKHLLNKIFCKSLLSFMQEHMATPAMTPADSSPPLLGAQVNAGGIPNIHNSCYMNATVQALAVIKPFVSRMNQSLMQPSSTVSFEERKQLLETTTLKFIQETDKHGLNSKQSEQARTKMLEAVTAIEPDKVQEVCRELSTKLKLLQESEINGCIGKINTSLETIGKEMKSAVSTIDKILNNSQLSSSLTVRNGQTSFAELRKLCEVINKEFKAYKAASQSDGRKVALIKAINDYTKAVRSLPNLRDVENEEIKQGIRLLKGQCGSLVDQKKRFELAFDRMYKIKYTLIAAFEREFRNGLGMFERNTIKQNFQTLNRAKNEAEGCQVLSDEATKFRASFFAAQNLQRGEFDGSKPIDAQYDGSALADFLLAEVANLTCLVESRQSKVDRTHPSDPKIVPSGLLPIALENEQSIAEDPSLIETSEEDDDSDLEENAHENPALKTKNSPLNMQALLNNAFADTIHHDEFRVPGTDEVVKEYRQKQRLVKDADGFLAVHLKRFEYLGDGRSRKISKPIQFPDNHIVDFSEGFGQPVGSSPYQIESFVVHMGAIEGGHYIAYAKKDGKWHEYDDGIVTPVDKATVDKKLSLAYMIMFEKVKA